MSKSIQMFRELGASGVVFGALTPDGDLDMEAMARLMGCAGDMHVTLHRAFDMTRDPLEALEDAVRLDCRTILTSGQARSAAEGKEVLRAVFRQAAGRLDIMAGSGVKRGTILEIHRYTGIRAFHTTGRRGPVESGMRYRKEGVSRGLADGRRGVPGLRGDCPRPGPGSRELTAGTGKPAGDGRGFAPSASGGSFLPLFYVRAFCRLQSPAPMAVAKVALSGTM